MRNYSLSALITFIVAISISYGHNKEREQPKWVDSHPMSNNYLYSIIGQGDGRTDALMSAMVELCQQIHSSIQSAYITQASGNNIDKIASTNKDCKIGKVEVIGTMELIIKETLDKGESIEAYKSWYVMTYVDGNKFFQIEEQIGRNEKSKERIKEISSKNCTISDVIAELESHGVSIKDTYIDDEMEYFLLLKANKKQMENIISK